MSLSPPAFLDVRLSLLRAELSIAGLDALIVTHPPNIRYLSGFSGSAGALVVSSHARVLVVDFRYVAAARGLAAEDAPGGPLSVFEAPTGLDEALVEVLRGEAFRRIGVEAAALSLARFNWLSARLTRADSPAVDGTSGSPVLVPTERLVERLRVVKDDVEVATLREAARRLSAVARLLPGLVRAGSEERLLAAEIDHAIRRGGFERPAFETIVASGPNGALPHARPGRRLLAEGDAVVLDFGGVYDGYCVDLTRTLPVGRPTPQLTRLFEAVRDARSLAVAAVRPGALASEVDGAAREALAGAGLAEAFGHGTGHGLGLEVHEEPRIGRALPGRADVELAAGMVFTIEPGVYIPGTGGVRIEDDVLVTAVGCEILTDVPIEL